MILNTNAVAAIEHFREGIAAVERHEYGKGVEELKRGLALAPRHRGMWTALSMAQFLCGEWEECVCAGKRAALIGDATPDTFVSIGAGLMKLGRAAEAEAMLLKAVRLDPSDRHARSWLGVAILRQGEWSRGFPFYESREPGKPFLGSLLNLHGKRVLLRSEQGYGDVFHFLRYAPLVSEIAEEVTVQVTTAMERLVYHAGRWWDGEGWKVCVVKRDPEPEHDVSVRLMTLPMLFGSTPGNVPPPLRVFADPIRRDPRIGLCWNSGERLFNPIWALEGRLKSVGREGFAPIIEAAGDRWVSLQFEDLQAEHGVEDWRHTSDIIAGLDLVITVDTAVAHLAGSLGVECWTLLPFDACWRWWGDETRTAWYPSMRLYRQRVLRDWSGTVADVAARLRGRLTAPWGLVDGGAV